MTSLDEGNRGQAAGAPKGLAGAPKPPRAGVEAAPNMPPVVAPPPKSGADDPNADELAVASTPHTQSRECFKFRSFHAQDSFGQQKSHNHSS